MREFEAIGLIIYLVLAIILTIQQMKFNQAFKNKQIDEKTYQRFLRKNLILIALLVILLLTFLYTPFKMIII